MPRLDRQYYDWLNSLNIGDPVAVRHGVSGREYTITTIESICGWERKIKVRGDNNIYTDGENIEELMNTYYLEPVTENAKSYVYRHNLIHRIKSLDVDKLSIHELEVLCETINKLGR